MNPRKLSSASQIAPIMFGTNIFGWTVNEPTARRLLDHFVERGFNAIDTADIYGKGESERIIGSWLKARGRRDDVVIATKVGYWDERPGLSAANVEAAVEDSLRRLQTGHIDVYFAHLFDAATPQEETLRAFDRLAAAGKVKAIGASNFDSAQLSQALGVARAEGVARYEVLQPLYNLYDRASFEADLQPAALANDVAVTPYFGLASGFLSGKYRSIADLEGRPRKNMVAHYLDDRGLRILGALDAAAATLNASPAQVAIAWLMAQPSIAAPIVSATGIEQLDELLAAADLCLSPEILADLDKASAPDATA